GDLVEVPEGCELLRLRLVVDLDPPVDEVPPNVEPRVCPDTGGENPAPMLDLLAHPASVVQVLDGVRGVLVLRLALAAGFLEDGDQVLGVTLPRVGRRPLTRLASDHRDGRVVHHALQGQAARMRRGFTSSV